MAVNSTCLENDKFGYACYTIVAPAPEELAGPLLEIERTADQERAKISLAMSPSKVLSMELKALILYSQRSVRLPIATSRSILEQKGSKSGNLSTV